MDLKKCWEFPPSARKNAFHHFLMVAAVVQMYLSSIAALISSTAVLKSSMNRGLTLQTWSLTQTHRKKLQRLQSGECRGQKTSDTYKMILSPLSKFRMVSEQWAVVARHWHDQWQIDCFQLGQMMSRSSKVSVTSMLTCLLHPPSISPPAPFHPWAKQTYIITGLFPCLK